jgi:N-acetylmuramoyl-L-alanine amidase
VCGPDTVRALEVLARQTGTGPGIAALRELESLTASARRLAELRVVVGQFGGLSSLSRQLVQALRQRSATVVASDEPDASAQAAAANRFAATVYVGFEARPGSESVVHYYEVPQFVSVGGQRLAGQVVEALGAAGLPVRSTRGMRLPILRETRMPAVLITIGSVQTVLDRAPDLVDSLVVALERWAEQPWLSPHDPRPVD